MERRVKVAMGVTPADLVLKGGNIVNVYSGQIEVNDIAIVDGVIAGIGHYDGLTNIDVSGKYLAPGFIDGHLHIESTMLSPANFAKAVIPWGTTTGICDPHEMGNVCGIDGIRYMIAESKTVPFDAKIMAPSCVPATPYEHNGYTIDSNGLKELFKDCYGVGEFMDAHGVVSCDKEVLKKLQVAKEANVVVDGHYPNATECGLNAYIGTGILTDHECVDVKDAISKLNRGMYILMREGSPTKNVRDLIGLVNPHTLRRICFCTDDKQARDLINVGHINNNIKIAIEEGVNPIDAITMATLNTAECYRLYDRGAIAPGKIADIVVIDNLNDFNIEKVYKRGKLVAENGRALFEAKANPTSHVLNTMHCQRVTEDDIKYKLKSNKIRVMGIIPHNVVTKSLVKEVNVENGIYVKKQDDGLSKLVVVERHHNTGNIGIGLLDGYNIKNGAVAVSVAHDSHNLIACGDNDRDIVIALNEIMRIGGGMTAVSGGKVYDSLELPIAGLMSDKNIEYISQKDIKLNKFAHDVLGVSRDTEAFMTLTFLSLVVIPELKISDQGLFDYNKFSFVSPEVDD